MSDHVALDAKLAEPTSELIESLQRIPGDILVLGVAGKMGPTLAQLAVNASKAGGVNRRVIGASRFTDTAVRERLEAVGVDTMVTDLFDRNQVEALPDAPNIVYMAGRKFGTTGNAAATWATNVAIPAFVSDRFRGSRIVAFSTGNVYPLASVTTSGPTEDSLVGPIGEYAQAALARERIFEFYSIRNNTPMAILRLNYAVEPRYGVLRDVADRVRGGAEVDVSMGYANVIWQRDANAVALRALEHCSTPPLVLNLTGKPAQSVRAIAEAFAARFGIPANIVGEEAPEALLSDASRCEQMFGVAPTAIEAMIDAVAQWMESGGTSLNRPTHFEARDGMF